MTTMTASHDPQTEPQRAKRGHELMPVEVAAALPGLYATDGQGMDAAAHLKLFSPWGDWTYYVTEFDGADDLYGYWTNGRDSEWTYASLREMAERVAVRICPAVERDCYFDPGTIRECAAERR